MFIWNLRSNRNLTLKQKSKMGLYHFVLTTSKTFVNKFTPTVFEKQQLPEVETTDPQKAISCLKRINWNVGEKYV